MRTVVAVCVVAFCIALAQAEHPQGSGTTTALELYPGLGHYHHPITTKNPEAQTYFDQGLTLLYGFNHDEAARYFRRAADLDPEAAMPYWGLALAIGPNYNDTAVDEHRAKATYAAVQQAVERGVRLEIVPPSLQQRHACGDEQIPGRPRCRHHLR